MVFQEILVGRYIVIKKSNLIRKIVKVESLEEASDQGGFVVTTDHGEYLYENEIEVIM